MKVMVTGGAGFIGAHLIEALLREGHEIVCIDNLNEYYDPALKRDRLAKFADQVTFYEMDIANKDSLEAIFKKHAVNAVFHLAAQAGVRYSIENPFVYPVSNVQGTLNVLEFAKRHEVSQVILASSSSVYGKSDKIPFSEDDPADLPMSIYAATKRGMELLAHSYHHLFGINTTCLRFFTVYGPYNRPDMALHKFTKNIVEGKPIDVYNKGEMQRDWTYVSDIVDGFLKASKKPMGFEIFNLGRGKPTQLMKFINVIESELGKKAVINFLPLQPGDVPITYADTSKAKRLLNYEAKVEIEEGVKEYIEWYREYYKVSL